MFNETCDNRGKTGHRPDHPRPRRRILVPMPPTRAGLSGLAGCGCKDKQQIVIQQSPGLNLADVPIWVWLAGVGLVAVFAFKKK